MLIPIYASSYQKSIQQENFFGNRPTSGGLLLISGNILSYFTGILLRKYLKIIRKYSKLKVKRDIDKYLTISIHLYI